MLSRRPHSITVLLALIPVLFLAACKPGGRQAERSEGVRRIILISIDTLRADHLGTYGHIRKTSPNLDALAAQGAVFEDTSTTAPWTLPAHSSMLTGFYPQHTHARATRGVLRDDIPTIAERLLAAGYRTSGVVKAIWFRRTRRLDRGFEKWRLLPEDESREGVAELTTDIGLEFLEQLDSAVGRLFRYIDERLGFADTLVIVTSDHGEGFFERGLFSHGQNQYQEQLHVPLILRGGPVPAGVRIEAPTSIVDIAPTIYTAARVAPKMTLPGVDLAYYWEEPSLARDERVLYSQSAPGPQEDVIRMARRGRPKLITNSETGQRELYDLAADPTERLRKLGYIE